MPAATEPAVPISHYENYYDPKKVLSHPEFRIIDSSDAALGDKKANVACAYNEKHEVHLIHKPMPVVGEGEVLVHVRATGICGYVLLLPVPFTFAPKGSNFQIHGRLGERGVLALLFGVYDTVAQGVYADVQVGRPLLEARPYRPHHDRHGRVRSGARIGWRSRARRSWRVALASG